MKQEFKDKFGLPQKGFEKPMDLQDTELGFSVYKNRTEQGFKSLFRVFIKNETIHKESEPKPVFVTASYGKETSDGIILSSSEYKQKRSSPVNLISEGEFFYNTKSKKLFYKNEEIEGIKLLEKVDGWHTKPTRPVFGLLLRTKLFWFHNVFTGFHKFFFNIFSALQYLISGKRIRIFHNLIDPKNFIGPQENRGLIINRGKPIKIFEYEVEPWIAALYCTVHLSAYSIAYFYGYKPEFLATVFRNNFLTTMYGIISLGLANTVLPSILEPNKIFVPALLFFQNMYAKCAFKKFKI